MVNNLNIYGLTIVNYTYLIYAVTQKLNFHFSSDFWTTLYGLLSKLKRLLAHEISKIMNFHKLQKTLYVNLRLLRDCGLIIPTRTNKKAYMYVWFILKTEDTTSSQTYFPIPAHF